MKIKNKTKQKQIINDIPELNEIYLTKLLKNNQCKHKNEEEDDESEIESVSSSDSKEITPPKKKQKQKKNEEENKKKYNGLYK